MDKSFSGRNKIDSFRYEGNYTKLQENIEQRRNKLSSVTKLSNDTTQIMMALIISIVSNGEDRRQNNARAQKERQRET